MKDNNIISEEYDYICYFDGAIKKNPFGKMGIGALVYQVSDGSSILRLSKEFPESVNNSNNVAEYLALIAVLEFIVERNLTGKIIIMGDSQMAIYQMNGDMSIGKGGIYREAALKAKELGEKIEAEYRWIPRKQNQDADALSKGK